MAALNDVYRLRIVTQQGQQTGLMVSHWKVTAHAGTGATDVQIAQAFDTAFAANIKSLLNAAASYRGVDVARIFPLPPTGATIGNAGVGAGAVAGDPLPRQVAGVITKRTAFAGRKFRGRAYMPFPSESDNDANGFLSVAYFANLSNLALLMKGTLVCGGGGNTDSLTAVIWHRATQTSDTITATIARTVWGTQRRRGDMGRTNVQPF